MMSCERKKLPEWFRVSLPAGRQTADMHRRLSRHGLHTVCESARCPNQAECWGAGTATVMILGDVCTRGCRFCNVATGHPDVPPDPCEPVNVARAVADAGLKYVVLTSVDRDDLPDGGAAHFAATVSAVRERCPDILVESLIPDYRGERLGTVLDSGVDVLAHNVEVVPRMTPKLRDRRASWDNSVGVLVDAAAYRCPGDRSILTKSSLMVGVGETDDEVFDAIRRLADAGVAMLTIGQYLQPTARHWPVERYVEPAMFDEYRNYALSRNISFVASGPLVRSSYRAAELFALKTIMEGSSRLANENSPTA